MPSAAPAFSIAEISRTSFVAGRPPPWLATLAAQWPKHSEPKPEQPSARPAQSRGRKALVRHPERPHRLWRTSSRNFCAWCKCSAQAWVPAKRLARTACRGTVQGAALAAGYNPAGLTLADASDEVLTASGAT